MEYVLRIALIAAVVAAAVPAKADESAGKDLFQSKCSTCHAKDAKGSPAMAKMFKVDAAKLNLTSDETLKKSDADLKKVIASGRGKMPSFKGKLTEEQMGSVLGYVRSLGKGQAGPAKPK